MTLLKLELVFIATLREIGGQVEVPAKLWVAPGKITWYGEGLPWKGRAPLSSEVPVLEVANLVASRRRVISANGRRIAR
eukprot:scaffold30779_cov1467-Skeletonema_menzelii.AAC.2